MLRCPTMLIQITKALGVDIYPIPWDMYPRFWSVCPGWVLCSFWESSHKCTVQHLMIEVPKNIFFQLRIKRRGIFFLWTDVARLQLDILTFMHTILGCQVSSIMSASTISSASRYSMIQPQPSTQQPIHPHFEFLYKFKLFKNTQNWRIDVAFQKRGDWAFMAPYMEHMLMYKVNLKITSWIIITLEYQPVMWKNTCCVGEGQVMNELCNEAKGMGTGFFIDWLDTV